MATQLSSGRTPLSPASARHRCPPHSLLRAPRPFARCRPWVGDVLSPRRPGTWLSDFLGVDFRVSHSSFPVRPGQLTQDHLWCVLSSCTPAPPQPHPPAHSLCPPGIWDLTPGLPALGRDCLWASQCPKTAGVPGVRAALSWVFCRPSAPAPVRVVNRGISLTHLKEATVGTGSS